MWHMEPSGFDANVAFGYPSGGDSSFQFQNNSYGYDIAEDASQHDFSTTSSYAHSSAAPSELDYGHNHRSRHTHLPQRANKPSRRDSEQSFAYLDSGYATQSTNFSPAVDMEFFPPFAANDPAFNQEYIPEPYGPASPVVHSDGEMSNSSSESTQARNHELYNVGPADDGLYYCPFAAKEGCGHEPKQLKCEYDKYIDSHLKPFRCRNKKCAELQFSSTACLLRHEREAHEMHGHEESLCEFPPCSRSMPGNGFRRSYNCKDHMTRCHGWVDRNPQESKKKRTSPAIATSKVTKTKTKVPSKKQQIQHLELEWAKRKNTLEELTHGLAPDGPLFAIALTQIKHEMETLKQIQVEWAKLTGRAQMG